MLKILFTYLTISKLVYFYSIILSFDSLEEAARSLVIRLLSQDIMIIISIVLVLRLEKLVFLKQKQKPSVLIDMTFYFIVCLILLALNTLHNLIMTWFLNETFNYYPGNFIYSLILFAMIMLTLNLKEHFKKKERETPEYKREQRMTALKSLVKEGVLSQKDFEKLTQD